MHDIQSFSNLFNKEAAMSAADFKEVGPHHQEMEKLKQGFPEMVALAGLNLDSIDVGYVSGSYSRAEATRFSDVDIECFAEVEDEYQDTFLWQGVLISFSVYPRDTVRGEGENIIDNSWAKSCFKSAYPLYDPSGYFEKYKDRFTAEDSAKVANDGDEFEVTLGLGKQMRKLIEYRRKFLSALEKDDVVMRAFAAGKFLETYAVLYNIFDKGEISSEKGQFDCLGDKDAPLRRAAEQMITGDISIQRAVSLTAPFFEIMQQKMHPFAQMAHKRPQI